MDFPTIPGLDKGALLASFCGAVAYLSTRDKMPPLRAVGSVIAGGIAAAYIGPAVAEALGASYAFMAGDKAKYATIFVTGVGGIWILNLIVRILEECTNRAGAFADAALSRLFGKRPAVPPVPDEPKEEGR